MFMIFVCVYPHATVAGQMILAERQQRGKLELDATELAAAMTAVRDKEKSVQEAEAALLATMAAVEDQSKQQQRQLAEQSKEQVRLHTSLYRLLAAIYTYLQIVDSHASSIGHCSRSVLCCSGYQLWVTIHVWVYTILVTHDH